jgi:SOS response regulatory protein OraA/RecX
MVRYKPQRVTKRLRTKRKKKDLDQIWEEIHNPHQNSQLKKILRKKKSENGLTRVWKVLLCRVRSLLCECPGQGRSRGAETPQKKSEAAASEALW